MLFAKTILQRLVNPSSLVVKEREGGGKMQDVVHTDRPSLSSMTYARVDHWSQ